MVVLLPSMLVNVEPVDIMATRIGDVKGRAAVRRIVRPGPTPAEEYLPGQQFPAARRRDLAIAG